MEAHFLREYLLPHGKWLRRTLILFSIVFLDYLITLLSCGHPSLEGNSFARAFMQAYGIPIGLTLFDLLMAIPLYVILCVDSQFVRLSGRYSIIIESLTDIVLGWLVAGAHMDGALSWIPSAPSIVCQLAGLVIYCVTMAQPFFWNRIFLKQTMTNHRAHPTLAS